jgi:NAD-dependent SIR2 family protein deacetylase
MFEVTDKRDMKQMHVRCMGCGHEYDFEIPKRMDMTFDPDADEVWTGIKVCPNCSPDWVKPEVAGIHWKLYPGTYQHLLESVIK